MLFYSYERSAVAAAVDQVSETFWNAIDAESFVVIDEDVSDFGHAKALETQNIHEPMVVVEHELLDIGDSAASEIDGMEIVV